MSRDASAAYAYLWSPGRGPDAGALARMAAAFPKPKTPMGEAWFMSAERDMYPQLLGELDAVPDDDILRALEDIASGSECFGVLDEWTQWFHYLLPRLVTREWRPAYIQPVERLVTAFMAQHASLDTDLPYPAFPADSLDTLGRCIMSAHFWPDGALDAATCLSKWTGPSGVAGWWRAGGLLSASLFFCVKYLARSEVESWFRSAIAIPDRYWRLQVITWLVGAYPILAGDVRHPSELRRDEAFSVSWDWSHCLRGEQTDHPFLPRGNRDVVLRVAREMEVETFLEDFWTDPQTSVVAAEVEGMPERFFELYGRR